MLGCSDAENIRSRQACGLPAGLHRQFGGMENVEDIVQLSVA